MFSVFSKSEGEATFVGLGSALPLISLSGYIWPLEGMPKFLKYISYFMPTTLPIQAMNNIFFRGWDVSNFHVYKGYLASICYVLLVTAISTIGLKFERK